MKSICFPFASDHQLFNSESYADNKQKTLQPLTPQLILHIFSFLSVKKLITASEVCKEWRVLSANQTLWNRFNSMEIHLPIQFFDQALWKMHTQVSFVYDSHLNKREAIGQAIELDTELKGGVKLIEIPKGLSVIQCFDSLITCVCRIKTLMFFNSNYQSDKITSLDDFENFIVNSKAENKLILEKKLSQEIDRFKKENLRLMQQMELLKDYPPVEKSYFISLYDIDPKLSIEKQITYINSINCEIPNLLEVMASVVADTFFFSEQIFEFWEKSVIICSDLFSNIMGEKRNAMLGKITPNHIFFDLYEKPDENIYIGICKRTKNLSIVTGSETHTDSKKRKIKK